MFSYAIRMALDSVSKVEINVSEIFLLSLSLLLFLQHVHAIHTKLGRGDLSLNYNDIDNNNDNN